MKNAIVIAALSLCIASNSLFAIIDVFVEIGPSENPEGYHTKLQLEKYGEGNILLTLPKIDGNSDLEAWLVVCEKARGEGRRNFRYEVHWPESKANKQDVNLVTPIKFEEKGFAKIQMTRDMAFRSYIVFGGHFDDGTFYTVDLPGFLKEMK